MKKQKKVINQSILFQKHLDLLKMFFYFYDMDKFSVIIPTMWLSTHIIDMINIYNSCNYINEIIIIDNAPDKKIDSVLISPKIIYKTFGKNIFVNPAWNLGVKLASNDNLLIVNDDILINEKDFNNLIKEVTDKLTENCIIGPAETCFKNIDDTSLKIYNVRHGFTYGFGTCMFIKKNSYTIIPDDILIFYGDVIQHDTNTPFRFSGIKIITPMSVTLNHDSKLHDLATQDHDKINKYNIQTLPKFI